MIIFLQNKDSVIMIPLQIPTSNLSTYQNPYPSFQAYKTIYSICGQVYNSNL